MGHVFSTAPIRLKSTTDTQIPDRPIRFFIFRPDCKILSWWNFPRPVWSKGIHFKPRYTGDKTILYSHLSLICHHFLYYYQNLALDCIKKKKKKKKYLHRETTPFLTDPFPGSWTRLSPELSKIRPCDPIFSGVSSTKIHDGPGAQLVLTEACISLLMIHRKANFDNLVV